MHTFSFVCSSAKCSAIVMAVIVLLPIPPGAINVMLRIRMQSGRDLGKHLKTKASQKPNISIAQSQLDHPHSILQI